MSELKLGDVVRLKSGGAPMTVTRYRAVDGVPNAEVSCVWFIRRSYGDPAWDGPFYGEFAVAALVAASEEGIA